MSLRQRAVALGQALEAQPQWAAWWRPPGQPLRWLHVWWELTEPGAHTAAVHIEETPPPAGGSWRIDVTVRDDPAAYPEEPPAATLRFVTGVDALMAGLARRYGLPTPEPLPRTRRERQWITDRQPVPEPSLWPTNLDTRQQLVAMPLDRFWDIVDSLSGTMADRTGQLHKALTAHHPADIAAFHDRLSTVIAELDTPSCREAAAAAIGWVSDDVFLDLRTWVVAQGRTATEATQAQPESALATLAPTDEAVGEAADFAQVPGQAYVARSGHAIDDDFLTPPAGSGG